MTPTMTSVASSSVSVRAEDVRIGGEARAPQPIADDDGTLVVVGGIASISVRPSAAWRPSSRNTPPAPCRADDPLGLAAADERAAMPP